MLFALPHFLTGDYEYSSGDIKDLCEDPETCVESDSKEKGLKKGCLKRESISRGFDL